MVIGQAAEQAADRGHHPTHPTSQHPIGSRLFQA